MDIRVLGPVEASVGGKPVFVGAGKPRALLAMLALNAGCDDLDGPADRGAVGRASRRRRRPRWCSCTSRSCARRSPTAATARRSSRAGAATSCGSATASWTRGASSGWSPAGAARERAGAVARRAARRRRRRAVRRGRDPPAGGAAARGARAGDRRRPGRRPAPRGRRRARGAGGRAPAARAPARAADARAVPLRPAGRGARGLPPGARGAGGGDRRRAGPGAAAPARGDPAPGPRRSIRRRPTRSSCRPSSTPARRWRAARPSSMRCASSGGARAAAPAGSCWSRARAGSARRGWRPSWPARCTRRRRGALRVRARARRRRRSRRWRDARVARRPTLLVLDDVDRAGAEVRTALGELVGGLAALPVLVLATAEDAGLAAGLRADATIVLAPLDADGVRAVARLYAGEREDAEVPVERLAEASGGVPQRAAPRRGRVGAHAGRPPLGATPPSRIAAERPVLRAAEDDLAGNVVELQAARERAERVAGRGRGRRRLPVQGSGLLRRRRRRGLLRARAARGRAGGAAGRRAAARHRRAVGQRQVVGAARRAARRARRRRAAGQRALGARAAAPGRAPAARARAGDGRGGAARPARGRGRPVRGGRSPPAATSPSARRSSTRSSRAPATRAGARWCWSPCAPTSTAAAPPTRSCRGCSAPTTCSSGRCAATSCAGRSSCPRGAPACASSPS